MINEISKGKLQTYLLGFLSLLDLGLTKLLIGTDYFLEANGLDNYILYHYGYIGLAACKLIPILIFIFGMYLLKFIVSKFTSFIITVAILIYLSIDITSIVYLIL